MYKTMTNFSKSNLNKPKEVKESPYVHDPAQVTCKTISHYRRNSDLLTLGSN